MGWLLRGLGLWRVQPRVMALGLVPAVVVLVLLGTALAGLLVGLGDLVAWATPFAADWPDVLRRLTRVVLAVAVLAGALVVSSLVFTGLTLAVGDPFYDRIWRATEELSGGSPVGSGLGWWRSVRDGAALAATAVVLGLLILLLGLVPLVGAAVAAVGGVAVSGWLLAGELLGRPLEARGLDRHARRDLLRRRRAEVWGFGVATQLCFLVPGGAVVAMPAAVAGATLLARELAGAEPGSRQRPASADKATPQTSRPDST